MNHIGPGKSLHCALYWEDMNGDEIFWPNESDYFHLMASEPYLQGKFTGWTNFYHFNGNVPILMGTVHVSLSPNIF